MKNKHYISILVLFFSIFSYAQQNSINIKSTFNVEKDELLVQQEIIFHNTSDSIFKSIFLHNWANSFKDRKTPLSKRFIEDFNKDLYFAKKEDLGFSEIKNLSVDFDNVVFKELENQADILEVFLKTPLKPKDSVKITTTYTVKIPAARFTGYGKIKKGYNLRYWYLTPAIYNNGWQLMSNLNVDDLYEKGTDFNIEINVPKEYVLESNLYQYYTKKELVNNYFLVGKNKTDIVLGIHKQTQLKTFKTKSINVHTDIFSREIDTKLSTDILNRELLFIQKYLGKYPHINIYIDKATQRKNPIYGLNQLPDFLSPFSDVFKWDISMFKALTKKYIENTILLNKRKDYWLLDGIQNYLLIEYVETFYPEMKLLGKVSDSWFLKKFNISKLEFNDKYPFIYRFSASKFLDQALTTSADSLSNFNRKIASKYKAGLGLRYLKNFVGGSILNETIKDFYQKNQLKITSSKKFNELLTSKTTKDLDWFFGDFISSNKKIDYTIDKIVNDKDSLEVTIKNKRNITAPVALYAIKDEEIKLKKWIINVDSTKSIKIKKGNFDKLVLNYENLYPELNTLDNSKSLQKKIFNKPLKFTFFKDVAEPNYNQLFYQPNLSYNFYNGLIFGLKLHNKPLIKRNLEFKVAPSYAVKSNTVIGSFAIFYNQFFEKTKIYKITYGVAGSTYDYAANLSYKSFIPFVNVVFKRKSLRETSTESISAKIVHINKEVSPLAVKTPQDNYSVFSLSYNYSKPDIIKELRYSFSTEFAKNFSKAAIDLRYRTLTTADTQLDFRFFAGAFFSNKSKGDYFSFGLDRANDYLFQLNYFGRSEATGFFSQQFIITEGGFKSVLPTRFANQYMFSFNSSIGIWRWVEAYNGVAFLKNRNEQLYFGYENGVRLNFVNNIFEVYFPFYSNNGWETSQRAYPEKIRFTITTDFNSIYNFFKRGFL
ncbi:MAG: aminopeptidase [Polaribacter sp.]|uniref:aminopeptidase n=1 Tax=Polaribacter sp. TaxID=1920175 RepID=UPI002F352FA8